MIDVLVNRIKDAYFDLERDSSRAGRFVALTQAFTPGAIVPSPAQMQSAGQMPPNTPLGPQPNMGEPVPEMGMQAPRPSLLDLIGASR